MNLDRDQLAQTLRSVALPALAGAAGTGALGAYASSQAHPDGETPDVRRRRILKNALIAASLGGVAGAALPTGLKTLAQPYQGSSSADWNGATGAAAGAVMSHALPLGVAGAGYFGAIKPLNARDKSMAIKHILANVREPIPDVLRGGALTKPEQVTHLLQNGGDDAAKYFLSNLAATGQGEEMLPKLFAAADLMQEAGHPGVNASTIGRLFPTALGDRAMKNIPEDAVSMAPNMEEAYARYLRTQKDPVTKLTSWLSRAKELQLPGHGSAITNALEGGAKRLSGVGELYGRFARPGADAFLRRTTGGRLGRYGLLAGGVYGAHKLQQALSGD